MIEFIEVRKETFQLGNDQTSDQINLSDEKRFGKYIVGGLILNQGDDVEIDGCITLAAGESMAIGVQFPYIDKSNYTVRWPAVAGNPDRRLVVLVFKAYPKSI